ncbi:MAG TPA: MarR family transcriptional regulator [Terriglobia bacterium]|nr:MarR family transcriptional regulator [Terriglobia bacterium]
MKNSSSPPQSQTPADLPSLRQLADFRYQLRKFLRFSERAARSNGLTPQQHQLLLGIAGFTGRGWATITELADFLQERHNAVVGLVQRAERHRLVHKDHSTSDRRVVRVYLLPKGEQLLARLTELHQREVRRFQLGVLNPSGPDPVRAEKHSSKRSHKEP